jgi:ArsR family transcriptional regulator
MPMDYVKQGEILKALGHPVRLKMLKGILSHDCHVSQMARRLNLPQSTVSQHLGVLRGCGIIAPQKKGVKTCYKVIDPKIRGILSLMKV